jgi:hypothetical protein
MNEGAIAFFLHTANLPTAILQPVSGGFVVGVFALR